jgi:fibronectin-binding autotransporter adhesin
MFGSIFSLGKRKNAHKKSSRGANRYKSLTGKRLMIENLERRELLTICIYNYDDNVTYNGNISENVEYYNYGENFNFTGNIYGKIYDYGSMTINSGSNIYDNGSIAAYKNTGGSENWSINVYDYGTITYSGYVQLNLSCNICGGSVDLSPAYLLYSGTVFNNGTLTNNSNTSYCSINLRYNGTFVNNSDSCTLTSNIPPYFGSGGYGNLVNNGSLFLNGYNLEITSLSGSGSIIGDLYNNNSEITIYGGYVGTPAPYTGSFVYVNQILIEGGVFGLANTYSNQYPPIDLEGGTLSFGSGVLNYYDLTVSGNSALQWYNNSDDISGLYTLQNCTNLTLDTNGNDVSLATGIGTSITKTGSGTLTLPGCTGGITVNDGALIVSGSISGNVTNNSSLTIGSLVSGNVTNNSSLTIWGSVSGNITNYGSLSIFGWGSGNVTNYGSLIFDIHYSDMPTATYSGNITGTGSLTKTGWGTLILSGSNSYTGGTTISNGTLEAAYTYSLPTSGLSVSSGATVAVSSANWTSANIDALLANSGFTVGFLGIDVSSGNTFDYGSVITGSRGVTKLGAGTLTLSGGNTYSNTTTISAGTLKINNTYAIPYQGNVIVSGTLDLNGYSIVINSLTGSGTVKNTSTTNASSFTVGANGQSSAFSGVIQYVSGQGVINLTKAGGGTLTLSGTNTYTGTTTISAGTLSISGSLVSSIAISANASLVFSNTSTKTYSGVISGSGSVTKTGNGTLILSGTGTNTYSGATTISTGTLQINNPNAIPFDTGKGNVTVNGSLDLYGNNVSINGLYGSGTIKNTSSTAATLIVGCNDQTSTFSGIINNTGAISLTKTGSGTLTLSGTSNNTYTGTTNIIQGTISIASMGKLGGATTAVTLGDQNDPNKKGILSYTGSSANFTRGFTINAGGGEIDTTTSGQTLTMQTGGITANGPLTIGGSGNTTISSVISGAGALTKTGSGTLTLSGTNTYTGGTTINDGVMQIGNGGTSGSLGTGPIANNAELDFNRSDNYIVSNVITNIGGAIINLNDVVGSTLTLTDVDTNCGGWVNNAGSGNLSVTGSVSNVGCIENDGSGTLTVSGNVYNFGYLVNTGSGTLQLEDCSVVDSNVVNTFDGTLTISASGSITGSSIIYNIGGGTINLLGTNNNYTGGTRIADSRMSFVSGGLGSGTITVSGDSTLQWYGTNNSLDISSHLTLQNGANVTFDVGTNDVTLATGFGNNASASITKTGAGTLTLSGNNTYTGGTTIDEGTLKVDGSSAFPIGNVTVDGVLDLNGHSISINGLSGSGTITNTDSDAVTLTVGNNNQPGQFSGTIQDNEGTIALTKAGTGTLTLSGVNTYSGDTTINAGTIKVDGISALPMGNVTVDGTLDLNGYDLYINGLSGEGTITNSTSAVSGEDELLTVGYSDQTSEFSGTIQDGSGMGAGTIALLKTGSGTLTLSGTNTYSGMTTVADGTLVVDGEITNSTVCIDGGTLAGGGEISGDVLLCYPSTISPGNGVDTTILDTGNLFLSASSTYSVKIDGDAVGTDYDQINVTGHVVIADSVALALTGSRSADNNKVIVIIQNDDPDSITDPVSGTFYGLSEGSSVSLNSLTYYITYKYNAEKCEFCTGNDVALIDASYYNGLTLGEASCSFGEDVWETTATLSVSASFAVSSLESSLKYTWEVTTLPSGAATPTFSANGTNAADNTTVTFYASGYYTFKVTVADPTGLTSSCYSIANVYVDKFVKTIELSLPSSVLSLNETETIYALCLDQFGFGFDTTPTLTWTASAGSITGYSNDEKTYTAPNSSGWVTITASYSNSLVNPSSSASAYTDSKLYVINECHSTVSINNGGFIIYPSSTDTPGSFSQPSNVTNSNTGTVNVSITTGNWTENSVYYSMSGSGTYQHIVSYSENSGSWTYYEYYYSSYTFTTYVDSDLLSTETPVYEYVFSSSGDGVTSKYSCSITTSSSYCSPIDGYTVTTTSEDFSSSTTYIWTDTYSFTDNVYYNDDTYGTSRSGSGHATSEGSYTGIYSYNGYGYTISGSYNGGYGSYYSGNYSINYSGGASGTGSATYSGNSYYSYGGSGSYTSGSGSVSESGAGAGAYNYSASYSLSGGSWITTSGSGGSSGSGNTHMNYSGSGTYSYASGGVSMNGAWSDVGNDDTSYFYWTSASNTGSGWTVSGYCSSTASGGYGSSYSGAGSYQTIGDGYIVEGTMSENGGFGNGYSSTTYYTYNQITDSWDESYGYGTSYGSGNSHISYTGDGNYWYASDKNSMCGEFDENGRDDSSYDYTINGEGFSGDWSYSGSGTATNSGNNHFSFSGAGYYSNGLTSGKQKESGGIGDSYGGTGYYDYGASGWSLATGNGSGSSYGTSAGSSEYHYSYSGKGAYVKSRGLGSSVGVPYEIAYSVKGTIKQSRSIDDTCTYNTTSTVSDGDWSATGSGTSSSTSNSNYSYNGSGTYAAVHTGYTGGGMVIDQTWFSSTASESGTGSASSSVTKSWTLANGSWSGTTSASSSGNDTYDTYNYSSNYHQIDQGANCDDLSTFSVQSTTYTHSSENYTQAGGSSSSRVTSGGGSASYYEYLKDNDEWNGYWQKTLKYDSWSQASGNPNYITGYVKEAQTTDSTEPVLPSEPDPEHQYSDTRNDPGFPPNGFMLQYINLGSQPTSSGMSTMAACSSLSTIGESAAIGGATSKSASALAANTADVNGGVASFACNSASSRSAGPLLANITDVNGGVTRFSYDSAGNLSSLTDPVGNTTSWTYTGGLSQFSSDENGTVPLYRVASETNALGATRYYDYDSAGNLSRYTDRNGQIRQYGYDSSGNVASETWYAGEGSGVGGQGSEGSSLATSHQPLNTIVYEYDSAGRITSESDAYSSVTYVYNDAGQITSTTQTSLDGPEVTLTYQYDTAGRRTQMAAVIDGTADFVDDYVYDSLGRVISVTEHGVTGGNAVAEKEIDFAYDDDGLLLSIDRYENGQLTVEADYTYDSLGRLTGLVYHQGMTVLNSYVWTYSGNSSVAGGQWSVASDGTWTPTGGLTPITDTSGVTDALLSGGYAALDSLLLSCTSSDGTATYTYDAAGQLLDATYTSSPLSSLPSPLDESYSYDANGNRVTADGCVYTTGADNRLLSDGTYRYEYDAEGNRVARYVDVDEDGVLDGGDTDVTEYTWDNRNRLVEVKDYATYGGDPTRIVDYLYDVENRWIGESIDSNGDGQIDHQIRFVYDGNQIVLQFDKAGSGTVTAADESHRYLSQPNAVDQLMADEWTHLDNGNIVSDEVLWALTDRQGSVNDLAKFNATTGATVVVDHIIRDSFGKVTSESDPSQGSLIGWTGRPESKATELRNHLNRWTDPRTAVFLSKDPSGLDADTNPYRYCRNNPTNATDPSGLDPYYDPFVPRSHMPFGGLFPIPIGPAAMGGAAAGYSILGVGVIGMTLPEAGGAAVAIRATAHGAAQLAARNFTRAEILAVLASNWVMTQGDGAKVFIQQMGNGRFNVIVTGANGIITALKNIDLQALQNLARNYKWH